MAKINLDNIYTSSKYITVMGLLKALIEDVDAVDYTPASDFTTLSTTVSTNTSDIASNKALINQNTANIATNKTNISANATSISTLNTKVDSNKESTDNSIAALIRNDTRHDSQLTTLDTKVSTNISDINNNKNNISINTKNIATNKANIATNKNDIATLRSAISNANKLYVHNIFIKDDQSSPNVKLSFTLLITEDTPLNREDYLRDVIQALTNGDKDMLINCVGIADSKLYYLFAYEDGEIWFYKEPGVKSLDDVNLSQSMITDTVLPTDVKLPTPVE